MRPRSPDWLSRKQAADLLGIDTSTLHRWRTAGLLAEVRTAVFGKYTYFARADVLALKERLEAGPDAGPDDK